MAIHDKIRDEKLLHIIKISAKISAWLSGKIGKYQYLTGEEILPPHQSRLITQVKFTYFALEKAFEKQKQKNN